MKGEGVGCVDRVGLPSNLCAIGGILQVTPDEWGIPLTASVQIIPNARLNADEVASRYFTWLEHSVPSVSVRREDARVHLHVMGVATPAIELQRRESDKESACFDVLGGFLVSAGGGGEFKFERVGGSVRIALTDFQPLLPMLVYRATHALVHELVMAAFCRSLQVPLLEDELHG